MTRLRSVLEQIRSSGRAALVPYLTAGDPSLSATVDLAEALVAGGADVLELGVPFSDPLADGPVIQRAAERALAAGTRLADVLECAGRIRDRTGVPIVVMSYLNPLLRYGWGAFTRDAAAAGVAGAILTDVPAEEAAPFLGDAANAGIGTVFLVAPTSSGERIRAAAAATTGFLYCVTRLGVTGARTDLSDAYRPVVEQVRAVTDLPVGVGFGISTPEHARAAGAVADAVIVGSRLVGEVESSASVPEAAAALTRLTRELRAALEETERDA